MKNKSIVHDHAKSRLHERFNIEFSWLQNELDNGRFVWLKGSGNSRELKSVRSAHLIYIAHLDQYCVVVIDDRSRLVVTVLTEEMALNSSWKNGVTESAKLKAKRIALGRDTIDDSYFISLYSKEREKLEVTVRAKTVTNNWDPKTVPLCKITIEADQIDILKKSCKLSEVQKDEVSKSFFEKVNSKEIKAYANFYISTSRGKMIAVQNMIQGVGSLEDADSIKRWAKKDN